MSAPAAFTCPRCGFSSTHPDAPVSGWCDTCAAHTGDMDLLRLRFRLFVDRQVADERWVHLEDPGFEAHARAVGDEQNLLAAAAEEAGRLWYVEVFDPARPPECAYARMGTDKGAMWLPIEITRREGRS